MRSIGIAVLAVAAVIASRPARAQESASAAESAYRDHMANGAKLVEEESHEAARVEFEAAYRARPTGSALVSLALADRALFRYAPAIEAIERALRDHAATLDPKERKAAEEALAEMRAQLGFVQVVLVPATATLRIDGEDQPAGASQRVIPLAPGSHRLEARLPGYTPAAQTITLTSGETAAIKLRLVTGDEAAADGVKPIVARGPYFIGALSTFVPLPPSDFSGTGVGVSVGARAGYRFAPIAGGELGFEYARVAASGQGRPSFAETSGMTYPLGYALSSFRFGAHVRLMTTGERVRFVQVLGGGVMLDMMRWDPGPGSIARQDAKGVDGFALSETGFEIDLRGGLIGLALQQLVGSTGGLTHAKHDAYAAETYGGPQYAIGIGLRGGYRLW
ncbi:PEGA domain protein [Minicystis rosea]|nr:PEGA domain protein [Minicystis rosea]